MAFGSWFKNIVKGAKNVIGKVLPKVKNVAETVGRFAPLINQAGNLIGGQCLHFSQLEIVKLCKSHTKLYENCDKNIHFFYLLQ